MAGNRIAASPFRDRFNPKLSAMTRKPCAFDQQLAEVIGFFGPLPATKQQK
jgi:hypothetical protein